MLAACSALEVHVGLRHRYVFRPAFPFARSSTDSASSRGWILPAASAARASRIVAGIFIPAFYALRQLARASGAPSIFSEPLHVEEDRRSRRQYQAIGNSTKSMAQPNS